MDNSPLLNQHQLDRLLIIVVGGVCISALLYTVVLTLIVVQPAEQVWVKTMELSINATSAIATAAAAIIALYLGLAGSRQQAKEAHARALLVATRVRVRLDTTKAYLDQVLESVATATSMQGQMMRLRDFAMRHHNDERLRFNDETLVALLPLGVDLSHYVASAHEMLLTMINQCSNARDEQLLLMSEEELARVVWGLIRQLQIAKSTLDTARTALITVWENNAVRTSTNLSTPAHFNEASKARQR